MASRIVRKVKRGKGKETAASAQDPLPAIVVTPPDQDMKVKAPGTGPNKIVNQDAPVVNIHEATSSTSINTTENMTEFNVNQLIAELSQNSRASKGEIESIQRKLLQQANEFLKVNAFANQPVPEPRIIGSEQKYINQPVYGRIPVVLPRNTNVPQAAQLDHSEVSRQNLPQPNMAAVSKDARRGDNQLNDTQLVPERLQETPVFPANNAGGMIYADQGNMQRVATAAADAGRGVFFYETGSAASRQPASVRAAATRGECLVPFEYQLFIWS